MNEIFRCKKTDKSLSETINMNETSSETTSYVDNRKSSESTQPAVFSMENLTDSHRKT